MEHGKPNLPFPTQAKDACVGHPALDNACALIEGHPAEKVARRSTPRWVTWQGTSGSRHRPRRGMGRHSTPLVKNLRSSGCPPFAPWPLASYVAVHPVTDAMRLVEVLYLGWKETLPLIQRKTSRLSPVSPRFLPVSPGFSGFSGFSVSCPRFLRFLSMLICATRLSFPMSPMLGGPTHVEVSGQHSDFAGWLIQKDGELNIFIDRDFPSTPIVLNPCP
jgi:hypothetical protein